MKPTRGLIVAASLLWALAGAAPASGADDEVQRLVQRVAAGERVPLVVALNAPFHPEGYLDDGAVARQRAAIARAQAELMQALPPGSYSVKYLYETTPYVAISVDAAGLAALQQAAVVSGFSEDTVADPVLTQSGPLIGADVAAAMGYTGAGNTVAILDTGVDGHHSHLAGKVVSEACYSTTTGTYESTCPGGVNSTSPGSGAPCVLGSLCYHGTHVAGIVAANGSEVRGIARDATLISIQVFSRDTTTNRLGAFYSDQKSALDRVAVLRSDFRIAAVNMSLGSDEVYNSNCDGVNASFAAVAASIDQLKSFDIATVIASGNSSSAAGVSAPSCIGNAISVGNTTKSDTIATSSNSGAPLDLLAPGSSIRSTMPGGSFASLTGTSMAAPHVAGAWAVLRSLVRPVDTIGATLADTGTPITDPRNGLVRPRINVDDAVTASEDRTPDAFAFADKLFVVRNTVQTSNTITVAGTNTSVPVTVTGGSYSKNGAAYTTAAGTAVAGDTLRVRHTSANTQVASVSTTLTVGGVSDTFTSTTEPVLASFSAATQSVNEGNSGTVAVTLTVNLSASSADTVTVPFTVSGTAANPADHNATTGSVVLTAEQTSTSVSFTVAGDTVDEVNETVVFRMDEPTNASKVCDAFSFTPVFAAPRSTVLTSNVVTIGGTTAMVPVSVSGGSYSKNGGAYTTTAGTAVAGDTFRLQHMSSSYYDDVVSTTLTVGGVSGTFTSQTRSAPEPTPCDGCQIP